MVARQVAALFVLCLLGRTLGAWAGELFNATPATPARAPGPWEARFMSAPPAEVLAAAGAVKAPADTPVVILFEETVHSFEDPHRSYTTAIGKSTRS